MPTVGDVVRQQELNSEAGDARIQPRPPAARPASEAGRSAGGCETTPANQPQVMPPGTTKG